MRLPWRRVEPQSAVVVVVVSGTCCMPGLAPFDEQARNIIEQAISETGVEARVQMMPATKAYFGGIPPQVMGQLISSFQRGQMPIPAILIDGKPVSCGVPKVEDVKAALVAARAAHAMSTSGEELSPPVTGNR